ncbi:MAG: polymerase subunit gamma/tau [Chloroflexota bacterium]|nr:polymerase subunit gamma/tau [Chloroflexota bacterium]
MSQAYYRKWRPQGWDEVIGQDHVVRTLRSALEQGNLAHAYLFSGPRGTGKTTTARIIAKAVNCLAEPQSARPCNECENCEAINQGRFLDLIEIDAASNTSVDDIRDLREKINFSPNKGRYKVYIIDEVHMLSNAAFNALLKTLEEPPSHAIFVLATTEVHKIPATVLSRCQRHEFRRIPLHFIQDLLKDIAEKEGVEVEPAALTAIARQATGSMRDAVSLLDQLASTGSQVTLELTQQVLGTAAGQSVYEVIETILDEDTGRGIALINQALDNGSDPRQFARQMVDLLRSLLMVRMGNADQLETTPEEQQKMRALAERFELEQLLTAIQAFDHAAQQTSLGWQPSLQLELALTGLTAPAAQPEARTQKEESLTPPVQAHKQAEHPPVKAPVEKKKAAPKAEAKEQSETHEEPQNHEISEQADKPAPEEKPAEVSSKTPAETPAEAPAETPAQPARQAAEGDVERIKESWKDIRLAARRISPQTAALLNSCRSVSGRKGRLVLSFDTDFVRSKMENDSHIENARAAVRQVTGVDIDIDCRVAGQEESDFPEGIDRDGMVGTALSLGGKITKKEKKSD